MTQAEQEFCTAEAAAMLSMTLPSLMKLLHAGRIGARQVDRDRRVPAHAIEAFRDRHRAQDAATLTPLGELANRVRQFD